MAGDHQTQQLKVSIMKQIKTAIKLATIGACTLALTACGKVNQENYDKLNVGMDRTEVENIIGSPDSCDTTLGVKSCIWGDDSKNIKVSFVADKATVFTNKGL